MSVNLRKLISWFLIPYGDYCYSGRYRCPFHFIDSGKPEQENGYCSYLKKGDWDFNEGVAEKDVVVYQGGIPRTMKYKDLPNMSLLWDQCKECNKKEMNLRNWIYFHFKR